MDHVERGLGCGRSSWSVLVLHQLMQVVVSLVVVLVLQQVIVVAVVVVVVIITHELGRSGGQGRGGGPAARLE